jgi:hypothetical protein
MLSLVITLVVVLAGSPQGTTAASGTVIYDSIPVPTPGAFPSQGFQATTTSEAGDHIAFDASGNELGSVVVNLTDWACENDYTFDGSVYTPDREGTEACMTTPGATFEHPITLNLYAVDNTGSDPAVGTLIATKTETFDIPYRPSWDSVNCATGSGKPGALSPADDVPFGGTWYSAADDRCFHGYAFNIEFDFSGDNIILPEEVIYGIAYNTQSYGSSPIGSPGPFSSLNASVTTAEPTVGTDVEANTVFINYQNAGFYCDGGAGGTETFRRDAGCWDTNGNGTGDSYTFVVQFSLPPVPPAEAFVSTTKAGTTSDNVDFRPEDILHWDGSAWSLFFDGSNHGLTNKHNIAAVDIGNTSVANDIDMTFSQNKVKLPNAGNVTGQDIAHFNGTTYSLYFDGSDVGLTAAAEKIDGLAILDGSDALHDTGCIEYLLISTAGAGKVPAFGGGQLKFSGEDILGFCLKTSGTHTTGSWKMFLDGSTQGMPKNSTNSISADLDNDTIYLTTKGAFHVDSADGGHSMVYAYDVSSQSFSGPVFDASATVPEQVDALHYVP